MKTLLLASIIILSWGSAGAGDGQFDLPRGLSTNEVGNVYVCDRDDHRMQQFTGTGVFLTEWGSFGTGEGQFNLPYGIRAGANGSVYVSDSNNFRVQMFQFAQAAVPATSEWGLVVMTLLMLTAGTVVFVWRDSRLSGKRG